MNHEPVSSQDLERLQVRAMAFRDRVDDIVAMLHNNEEGEHPPREHWSQLSAADAASRVIAKISEHNALRSDIPDWYGPKEQLSVQVAFHGATLMDEADWLLSEVEADKTHSHPCRCDELRSILDQHIQPALDECQNLLAAIEQLRHLAPGE